jgi:hypothetical protein
MANTIPTTLVNRSGAVTTGGTAQTAAAQFLSRRYFLFQNISDETMWVNFGVTAVADQPSISVVAGGALEFGAHTGVCPNGFVSVISATTGKKFVCKEA